MNLNKLTKAQLVALLEKRAAAAEHWARECMVAQEQLVEANKRLELARQLYREQRDELRQLRH